MSTTVLLVDDTPSLRALARLALEIEGWEIVGEADDGEAGIQLAYDLAPDVIVLDQHMPGTDGLSALPRLRRASPASRILMWSIDEGFSRRALDAGASATVDKNGPIDHLLVALALLAPSRDAAWERPERPAGIERRAVRDQGQQSRRPQ
jgi:DNA-binding NarL/FixJ family response regulator